MIFLAKRKQLVYYGVSQNINPARRNLIMAYVISDDCVSCGTYAGECPVGAIVEGDGKYEINADECLSCGTCEGACPVGAISAE